MNFFLQAAACLGTDSLLKALDLVAFGAQALHVVVGVAAAFGQRDLVITLGGQAHTAMPLAQDAQWIGCEQCSAGSL